MTEFTLVDYFAMGETIGIVATLVVSFYYSRKQMQKLSIDIETKVSKAESRTRALTTPALDRNYRVKI